MRCGVTGVGLEPTTCGLKARAGRSSKDHHRPLLAVSQGLAHRSNSRWFRSLPLERGTHWGTPCVSALGGRSSRKLAHNTYLIRDGSAVVVRFHATEVATMAAGAIRLNSGGWRTVTTKERLGRVLPLGWSVYSDRREWYLSRHANGSPAARWPFADGITIGADGAVTGCGS
jgi:hypothetical protein